jgi:hypothetical protein
MAFTYSPTSSIVSSSDIFLTTDSIMSPLSPFHPLSPMSPLNHILTPDIPKPLVLSWATDEPRIGVYETIDNDPIVREKMINYYFDKLRDDWLLDEMNDLLAFFTYKDGKVHMIRALSNYNPDSIKDDTDAIAEKKVEYIEEHVFSKYDLEKFMKEYTRKADTRYVMIPKSEYPFRETLRKYIKRKIKKMILGGEKKQDGGVMYF